MSLKKSQVTIFIILGILILFSIWFFLYKNELLFIKPVYIPNEIRPIHDYITKCAEDYAKEGLARIGITGGFITYPEEIELNPRSYLSFDPTNRIKNPYWWHEGISAAPTLEFMGQQINDFLATNFKRCINGFEPFTDEFIINELASPGFKTSINKNDVTVDLYYPLEIINRINNTKREIEDFKIKIPVRLKMLHELAKEIMENENKDAFLERIVISLMSIDEDIPTTDMEFGCNRKKWKIRSVATKLKRLMDVNFPYIRIVNTDYTKESYVPSPYSEKGRYSESYFQAHYLWKVSDKNYPNVKATVKSDIRWPLKLNAQPSDGETLMSNVQKGTDVASLFCINMWHFLYDIEFPVKISLIDDGAGKFDQYGFNFAFLGKIYHNQASRVNYGNLIISADEYITNEEFCNDLWFENSIFTWDNVTEEPLTEVNLSLVCGRYTCNLGESDVLSYEAGLAGIQRFMPYCTSGVIRASAEDYQLTEKGLQTDGEFSWDIYLIPFTKIGRYKVVKHPLANPKAELELNENEKAYINIKSYDGSFEKNILYPSEYNEKVILMSKKDFDYDLTIYLMSGEDIVGGYKGEWNVKWDELSKAEQIKFHVVDHGISAEKDYQLLLDLSINSAKIPNPELK